MGADTSRFYASTEDSGDLDSYIKRGGARLVNRERQLTTSTTLHLGGVDGAGEEAGDHRNHNGHEECTPPSPEENANNFLNIELLSLEEFQDLVASCTSDFELSIRLQREHSLPASFLEQTIRRALASGKADLLRLALDMNTILPPDSTLRIDDSFFLSMLMRAVKMEELDPFRVLLPHIKPPVTAAGQTELQSTALLAAEAGNAAAVRLLCFTFPICLEQTLQGRSVFLEAAQLSGDALHSALGELLEMGIYVNTQGPDGSTALHAVVRAGDVETVKLLLSHEACATLTDSRGKRAVDLAMADSTELTSLLARASLSPLPHEVSLYHAAQQEGTQFAQCLLAKGISVNSKWIHGRTALVAAARAGNVTMVKFLLSRGAEAITLGCYWPELALVHALVHDHTAIALLLMRSTEELLKRERTSATFRKHIRTQLVFVLHYCAQIGAVSVAAKILSSSCRIDPNEEFRHNLAPIHVACRSGRLRMVCLLLQHGTRPDLPSSIYRNSPLHYACFYGHTDIGRLLLCEPGASVNCTNTQHATPLYCVLTCELTPHEKQAFVREVSVIFLLSSGAMLIKPGRNYCELKEFNLAIAAQRWPFVPVQTQKLVIVLRDEGRNWSLCSETRLVIRGAIQAVVNAESVSGLGLPFRLQRYVLFKEWFTQ